MFAVVMSLGLGVSVSAQNEDQKRPPKEKPPVREPKPKENPPKGDKPKKPGMSFYLVSSVVENNLG